MNDGTSAFSVLWQKNKSNTNYLNSLCRSSILGGCSIQPFFAIILPLELKNYSLMNKIAKS
jgi:hypothetical protein